MQRDKVSLDVFWLRDESLEDMENLSDPDVLDAEIVKNLQAAEVVQSDSVALGRGTVAYCLGSDSVCSG